MMSQDEIENVVQLNSQLCIGNSAEPHSQSHLVASLCHSYSNWLAISRSWVGSISGPLLHFHVP